MAKKPPPCESCRGACCRYVALQIDKPSAKRDYDNIRWYLLHENVRVFIDHDGDWHAEFITNCTRLTPDFRCASYKNRPRLCRTYPPADTECEAESNELPYQTLFATVEEFEGWLNQQGVNWRFRQ